MSELIDAAERFVTRWVFSRRERGEAGRHLAHCRSVARLVAGTGAPAPVVAAAWLHHALDELGVTRDALFWTFGENVLELVVQVSRTVALHSARAAPDRTDHRLVLSPDAQTILAADICDRLSGQPREHKQASEDHREAIRRAVFVSRLLGADRELRKRAETLARR